jgi:hypothetical protein
MADQSVPTPKKRVPLGKALHLTPEELDAMSIVTPADIVKAQQFWREHAPRKYSTLLDAQVVDEQPQEKKP